MRDFPDFLALIALLAMLALGTTFCVLPHTPAEARLLVVTDDHPGPVGDWQPALARQIIPKLRSALPPPQGAFNLASPPSCVGPLCDPCPDGEGEERVRCWIDHAFPEQERATAFRVAEKETGEHLHPWQENYDQFLRETGRWWTPERARYVPAEERAGWKVYGLFQHRWEYWPERAQATLRFHGWNEPVTLDPFDGWHNTLVSAWLAGWQGWWHWDVCSESAPSDYKKKFRCGPGRWLR